MGCDPHLQGARPGNHSFQSTHPVWGATADVLDIADKISISIHAPRMGCDDEFPQVFHRGNISIHAPRMGCDNVLLPLFPIPYNFNPRTPYGVRHPCTRPFPRAVRISIHAPRMGCDYPFIIFYILWCNFNPRTPYGVRRDFCS